MSDKETTAPVEELAADVQADIAADEAKLAADEAKVAPAVTVGCLVLYVIEQGTAIRAPVLSVGADGLLSLLISDEHGVRSEHAGIAYDASGAVGTWHTEG